MVVGAVTVGLVGLVGLLPLTVDPHAVGVVLAEVDVGWPVTAGLLVLVSTAVAYLTGIGAIRRIGASRASLVGLLEVISSAVASWLLLDEVPAAARAVGGALILAGVSLTQTAARRPTHPPSKPARPHTGCGPHSSAASCYRAAHQAGSTLKKPASCAAR
jgi:drug/metabolite transporter (DMT)-like permease